MAQTGYTKYKLVDYFDVWGNAEDGYEVNNLCCVFDDLYIDDTATEQEIINYLISIDYLSDDGRNNVQLSGFFDMLEIERIDDGYPLGRLEAIEG